MSVRGPGRGGKSSGPKGPSGPQGGTGPSRASGPSFGDKVGKSESLVGPSGAAGSGNVAPLAAPDPVTAKAVELIRQLQTGELKSKDEATRKLVADILREKVRTQSKMLTERIMDHLDDDPRLKAAIDRLWKRAEEQE